jgi:hypothetical protein
VTITTKEWIRLEETPVEKQVWWLWSKQMCEKAMQGNETRKGVRRIKWAASKCLRLEIRNVIAGRR